MINPIAIIPPAGPAAVQLLSFPTSHSSRIMATKGKGSASSAAVAVASATESNEKDKRSKCFDDLDHKNIVHHTIVGQESITDKKTGEVWGPFHVAMHVKVRE
jgi:hypothetical protein